MQGLGAHQPRVATSLLERSHQLPCLRVAWQGLEWGPMGQALQEAMRRPSIRAGRRRKGLIGATRNESLTGSLGGLVSELILNAKREMGVYGEQAGRWEEAGLRSYLDPWLSPELFRAGASKPSASPRGRPRRARTQSGHALFRWHRCGAPLVRAFAATVPPSPKAHC